MICHGNTEDHCCIHNGVVCEFLEENTVEGRRWACGLRRETGSWTAILKDPRYIEVVQPKWDRYEQDNGVKTDCKSWPPEGASCNCSQEAG